MRSCRHPGVERLEELVLLSSTPVVNLAASGGSGGGTSLVKDIPPDVETSSPSSLVNVDGKLFFLALNEGVSRNQLWVSDGTTGGTIDLTPGLEARLPLALGDSVIFIGSDSTNQFGLWSSDGTAEGTHQVASLPRLIASAGVSADGVVYFDIFNLTTFQFELWKSDGTATGTGLVSAIPDSANFTVSGSNVFFQGTDFETGGELWVSDGTGPGTHLVADINPGFDGSFPSNLTDVGGTIYFTAFDALGFSRLWKSDGTAEGTSLIDPSIQPVSLASFNGRLAFTVADPDGSNAALWTTDGTPGGTALVANLPTGQISPMVVAGGRAFFGLRTDSFSDLQLWSSDGTGSGTFSFAEVARADQLTASGGRIYFVGEGQDLGQELWSTDGTAEGTAPVADINPGLSDSNPMSLTDVGGVLYFSADDGDHGRELWQSSPGSPSGEPPATVNEGSPFVFTGSFDDPDDGPWTATVNYGDGSGTHELALNGDHTFSLNHAYADNGSYILTVRVTDSEGMTGVGTMTVTVINVAPEAAIVGVPLSSPEGGPITLSSVVSDPGSVDQDAGFTTVWTVTLDGEVVAGGTGASFSFTPDDNGTYVVTLTAEDKDGAASDTSSQLVVVANLAPSVTLVGVPAGSEGSPVSFTASVSDPSGADQTAGFDVSWAVTRNGVPFASGTGGTVSFTPGDDGTYVVTATAADKDGGSGSATATITVVNTAPTASIVGAPATAVEGTAISLAGLVTDPSPSDTAAGFNRTWTVTRNGSPFASGTGATFGFIPTDNGVYVVALTATDKDGGSSSASATIAVSNAVPTASLTGDSSGVRGQTRNFVVAATDPSSVDAAAGFTFQINWGDGSPIQTIARGQSPSVGHAYAATGTYTVQVKATDKDGGVSLVSSRVVTIAAVQLQADPADPSKTALVVGGTTGNDDIEFRRDGSNGRIQVRLNGKSLGTFTPTGHVIAFGQAGCDDIEVADNVSRPSILHGGDGDDTLEGGGGDAILIGGSGRNRLRVDSGRNLLIGGSGGDQLSGGCGDNIMITGSTAYDANDSALIAILTEWERNTSLTSRVNNLKRGIAGGIRLDSTTVFNDRAYDSTCDHDGHDWILADSSDRVRGRDCDSIISRLDRRNWDSPSGH